MSKVTEQETQKTVAAMQYRTLPLYLSGGGRVQRYRVHFIAPFSVNIISHDRWEVSMQWDVDMSPALVPSMSRRTVLSASGALVPPAVVTVTSPRPCSQPARRPRCSVRIFPYP